MKKPGQPRCKLRVCASCEWIFDRDKGDEDGACPKCHFAHYGAHYVYGRQAYRFAETQQPWIDRKVARYLDKLHDEIDKEQN